MEPAPSPRGARPRPTPPRLVVVCGLPGAGKTTLARRVAAELPAVRMCPDEWMLELGIDLYDQPARARIERIQRGLAEETLRAGASVVIEWGVWSRAERDDLLALGRGVGAAVELRYLDVALDDLRRRIEARNLDPEPWEAIIDPDDLVPWSAFFEAPDAAELARFDPPLID